MNARTKIATAVLVPVSVAALAACAAASQDAGNTGATAAPPHAGASTYCSIFDTSCGAQPSNQPSSNVSTYHSIFDSGDGSGNNTPVPEADNQPVVHHQGSSVCFDSMYPGATGLRVLHIGGTSYLVAEVDTWCNTLLSKHHITLLLMNLNTGKEYGDASDLIPNRNQYTPAPYVLKAPCVAGSYAFHYVASVTTYDGRKSVYGNIGDPLRVTASDCR